MESNQLIEVIYFLEDSFIGEYIRGSLWLFPVIQSFHLLGLAILGGSIVICDFRLLGLLLRSESAIYVLSQTRRWFNFGLLVLIVTGIPLFLSEAVKCYYSRAFWIKITCLIIGVLFVYFVRNPLIQRNLNSLIHKLIGVLSFSIWVVVAASGRWIGFS
tara:strand:- start:1591 stop:2067 length:477 start_codon:yes stop_codon:yes gene_type:complete